MVQVYAIRRGGARNYRLLVLSFVVFLCAGALTFARLERDLEVQTRHHLAETVSRLREFSIKHNIAGDNNKSHHSLTPTILIEQISSLPFRIGTGRLLGGGNCSKPTWNIRPQEQF